MAHSSRQFSRISDRDHFNWLHAKKLTGFKAQTILDVGCGTGDLCRLAVENGAHLAVGIDIKMPTNIQSEKLKFLNFNLDLPNWADNFKANGFDKIFAFDILEHLESPVVFLRECRKLLSKNGFLIITTPNVNSWERYLRPSSWSGVQDEQHKILFNLYSLRFLLQKLEFKIISAEAPIRKLGLFSRFFDSLGGQQLLIVQI